MPARRAFESLLEELTGDRALRRLAIDGVLKRLNADRERYSREEVEEGLEDLLHDVQYLGYAVHGVLSGAGADEGKKARVAALYVEVAELYSSGGLPRRVRETSGGSVPEYAVEAAAFLDARGKLDLLDVGLVKALLSFTDRRSSVAAKGSLLSSIVRVLNGEGGRRLLRELELRRTGERFLRPIIPASDHTRLTGLALLTDLLGRDVQDLFKAANSMVEEQVLRGLDAGKRNLLMNLVPLLASDRSGSSYGPLADLSALSGEDLIRIFMDDAFFSLNTRSRRETYAMADFARGMARRGVDLHEALRRLREDWRRDQSYWHAKALKALLRAMDEVGTLDDRALDAARELLSGAHVDTGDRLALMRFLYAHTGDRSILEGAMRSESRRIREWARREAGSRERASGGAAGI